MGDVDKKHYTGHRARLRKRFLNDPHNVYAYEMMDLLLGYVIRRGDTTPLAKELVERIHDTANRRRVYIRISRHGLEMMDELKQSMLKSTTAALSAYSEDELEELDHCLCRLTKLMEKFNADGC